MIITFVSPWKHKYGNFHLNGIGIEQQIIGISTILHNSGIQVYILTRCLNDYKQLNEFENITIVEVYTKYGDSLLSRFEYSRNVASIIKKINPDIIHLTDIIGSYLSSKLNYPKIYTAHMISNKDMKEYNRRYSIKNYLLFSVVKFMETEIIRKSNMIVALNEEMSNYFIHYRHKMVLIPNGTDINGYVNKLENNTILYAGRLSPIKNIGTLISAFSEISNIYPSYKLQIVGSGIEEVALRKMVQDFDIESKVEFIPHVENKVLRRYLSECTIFVLPSLFETFGIVIIEAMASGKPVIASAIPGPKDIITNGYDGILFEKGNVNELKKALIKLLDKPSLRKEIGINAKKTVEKYSYEYIGNQYRELYTFLMENNNVNC